MHACLLLHSGHAVRGRALQDEASTGDRLPAGAAQRCVPLAVCRGTPAWLTSGCGRPCTLQVATQRCALLGLRREGTMHSASVLGESSADTPAPAAQATS